jgi:hypothetical protein
MDLKEFVKNVLLEVNEAVDEAGEATSREIRFTQTNSARTIEFDVAVTASKETAGEGKAGVKVLTFIDAGGKIAQQTTNSTVSRVQFGLYISDTTKAEDEQHRATILSESNGDGWPGSF